ncbi:MAG: hypothetical protein V7646_4979 [Pseudonocardia sp.]|jgi:hypothetical protein
MSVDTALHPTTAGQPPLGVLDVAVPAFNEESDLEPPVRRLHAHLSERSPSRFRITIAVHEVQP